MAQVILQISSASFIINPAIRKSVQRQIGRYLMKSCSAAAKFFKARAGVLEVRGDPKVISHAIVVDIMTSAHRISEMGLCIRKEPLHNGELGQLGQLEIEYLANEALE